MLQPWRDGSPAAAFVADEFAVAGDVVAGVPGR